MGVFLAAIVTGLVVLIAPEDVQKSNSARYVASFLSGLFSYTTIESLRRSLD